MVLEAVLKATTVPDVAVSLASVAVECLTSEEVFRVEASLVSAACVPRKTTVLTKTSEASEAAVLPANTNTSLPGTITPGGSGDNGGGDNGGGGSDGNEGDAN